MYFDIKEIVMLTIHIKNSFYINIKPFFGLEPKFIVYKTIVIPLN
jgi:hypothetical protein